MKLSAKTTTRNLVAALLSNATAALALSLLFTITTATASMGLAAGHNFTGDTSPAGTMQSCIVCHATNPLEGDVSKLKEAPGKHETMYTMYTTVNGNRGQLSSSSKLCLSCHDGVTAADTSSMQMGGRSSKSIGTDLTNDHPIGVAFPPRNKKGMLAKNYFSSPRGNVKVFGTGQKRVECSSCHDPHDNNTPNMLRETTRGSQLCLSCHNL